jgi:hypothetical protein
MRLRGGKRGRQREREREREGRKRKERKEKDDDEEEDEKKDTTMTKRSNESKYVIPTDHLMTLSAPTRRRATVTVPDSASQGASAPSKHFT